MTEKLTTDIPVAVKVPEGFSTIIINEAQVIVAVALVFLLKGIADWFREKSKKFYDLAARKKHWSLERETEIRDIISEILFLLKADRVVVSHFVNGGTTISGMSLKKLKITFEKVMPGISRLLDSREDIAITKILPQVIQLKEAGDWVAVKTSDLPEGSCRAFLVRDGVAGQLERLIVKDDIPVAIITIQYTKAEMMVTKQVLSDKKEMKDLISRLIILI